MRNIGSVNKLPSGSYRIEYNVKGKRYRKTVKAKNITEARKYLNDFIASINNNTFQDKVAIRFDEFASFWFEKHAKVNLSPTTAAGYKTILNKKVLPAIGDVYLSDITKIQIQDILSDLKRDGLTSKTQKRYWSVISSILSFAVENDYLKYNVAASIKIRPDSTEHKTEMQIYDHSELELLYDALDKEIREYFIAVEKDWNSPEKIMARALVIANNNIKQLQANVEQLQIENKESKEQIELMKPKVNYVDEILKCKNLMTITQIAKDYGMSGQRLNELLHKAKIQYKQGEQWLLYSKYAGYGLTASESIKILRKNGYEDIKLQTKWTQKGRFFIYKFLTKNGVKPLIERGDIDDMPRL